MSHDSREMVDEWICHHGTALLQLPWRRMLNNTNHTRRALVLEYNTVMLLINTSDIYVWPSFRSVPQCLVALASSWICVHDILIHNLAREMRSVTGHSSRSHERLPKNSKNLWNINKFRVVHRMQHSFVPGCLSDEGRIKQNLLLLKLQNTVLILLFSLLSCQVQ